MLCALRTSLLARISVPALLASAALAQSWVPRTVTPSPSARNASPLVYDASRGGSVLFGGYDGTNVPLGDTWRWNGSSWSQLAPAASPTARWGHGMVYDTRRSVAVLHGGYVPGTGMVSDTWEWDGANWAQRVTANSPVARGYFGMAYDSVRGRSIAFGGVANGLGLLGDTWEYDGVNWSQVTTAHAPSARRGAAMTFDAARARVVMFGGGNGPNVYQDTWTYDGLDWVQRTPATQPTARQEANLVNDMLSGESVLMGGVDAAFAQRSNETWKWDGANWAQLTGSAPPARNFGGMSFDLQRGMTVLFGGIDTGVLGDTWELASAGVRTMSTLTMPDIGQTASFQYAYPPSASGHFYWQLLTSHMIGSIPLQVPGFVMVGEVRCNIGEILLDWTGFLDAAGSRVTQVQIPNSPVFAGYAFDVQALDIDLNSNTVFFSRNDAEVRIGQASSGTTYTETLSTGQAQVIPASSNVQVAVPAGLVAPGSPIVVEVDTTPETWLSDANYTAGSVSVNLALDPNALMTSDYIDVEIPIGNLPLQDVSANSPGVLNGSVYVFVAPGVGVAVPTQVVTTYTLTGGIRRAVGRIARTVLNLAVLAARAVVQTVTDPVGVLVHVITIAVRVLNCLINGAPPQMALYKWDRNTSDWGPFALPSTPHRRACIVVHGIQLFANSTSAGPSSIRQLGQEMSSAVMPYSQVSLYDAVYGIGYQDSAGIAAIGDSVRALLAGVSANEIDFVCHSLGGLVVRWANEISASPAWSTPTQRISRIVTLGTPHEGVPAGVLQTAFGNSFPLAPIQHCYGQHLTDGAAGSEALTRLRNSQPSNVSTRIYAYAGTRWDDYQSGAGRFIHNLYMGTESDGFVPRYSGLSGSLYAKGDVRARDTVYLNHSTLITDIPFLQGTVLPRLMEDRPGSVPVADFTATPPFGAAPLSVQFTDTSSAGATAWQWDFDNDGVVDSTQRNPSHVYTTQGTYSVRLDVTYPVGVVSKVATGFIRTFVPNPALNMVPIAAGTFQMGSTVVGGTAAPVHPVTITRPFWAGKYEVTQAEYQAVRGSNPSLFQGASYPNAPLRPVERVTWNDAMAYCSALTATEAAAGRIPAGYQYRLPTEAEWEHACRAGTTTEWNTGASLSTSQANFNNVLSQTTVVGSYAANPWGLFDTHGNVWEWCLDSWDGSANYPSSAVFDPYVSSGRFRVLRGGSWFNSADDCRSAFRGVNVPGISNSIIGFRVVLAPVLVP